MRCGRGERPPVPFKVKLKMLFLQHIFNLSDEELEDQLIDRLSFLQFIPDHERMHEMMSGDERSVWADKGYPLQAAKRAARGAFT